MIQLLLYAILIVNIVLIYLFVKNKKITYAIASLVSMIIFFVVPYLMNPIDYMYCQILIWIQTFISVIISIITLLKSKKGVK